MKRGLRHCGGDRGVLRAGGPETHPDEEGIETLLGLQLLGMVGRPETHPDEEGIETA